MVKSTCVWEEDSDGDWNTDCDNIFVLIDGTPKSNNFIACCYCGKMLEEKLFKEDNNE